MMASEAPTVSPGGQPANLAGAHRCGRLPRWHCTAAGGTLSVRLLASTSSGHRPQAAPSPAAGEESAASGGQLNGNGTTTTPKGAPMSSAPATPRTAPQGPGPCTFSLGTRTWPDCSDTGVPTGTKLTKMTSPRPTGDGNTTVTEIRKSGTVIKGVVLTGSIDVWADK